MYVTSMVAVQHWFDKRRAMATGLAVSGSGVGTLTFGYLTQKLVEDVGWRNTVRIQVNSSKMLLCFDKGLKKRFFLNSNDGIMRLSQFCEIMKWKTSQNHVSRDKFS